MKKIVLTIISLLFLSSITIGQNENTEKLKKELKPALLIVDVQNQFVPMMDQGNKDFSFQMINSAIYFFRQYDLPIIRIYHTDENIGPKPDSEGFKFAEEIAIEETDPMIIKTYGNAFTKTDLDKILSEKDVNTIFLCGLSATGCVLATYIGAQDFDYNAFMIKYALLSPENAHTELIETIMNSMSLETIMFLLEYTQ